MYATSCALRPAAFAARTTLNFIIIEIYASRRFAQRDKDTASAFLRC